jgi:protein-S-isoprenylcysteine O-methyltransferase Ste14
MPRHIVLILAAGWLVWMIPFFLIKGGGAAQQIERRARWGIALEAVGFFIVWAQPLWIGEPPAWRLVAGIALLLTGGLLTWTSARTLGRQWRFDAGLNADHQLVQAGAYSVVRHPIYTSMLCMLVGTGLLITHLLGLAVALVFFIVGTEIRVRIEDSLLASRFGDRFTDYKRQVHAYLPFVNRFGS